MKKEKNRNVLTVLLRLTGILLLTVCMIFPLGILIPKLFGITSYAVISPSMEPSIPVGSLVFSKETDPSLVEEGDVITFYANEMAATSTTHRVIENDREKRQFITKGDANDIEDIQPIPYLLFLGKTVYVLEKAGWIALFLSEIRGKIVFAIAFLLGVFAVEAAEYFEKRS